MSKENNPYAERLRSERGRLGLSQAQLAAAGGLSKATQVAYEGGLHVPDLEYADRVQMVGVDKIYLCTGQHEAAFVSDRFDWELHREILRGIYGYANEQGLEIPPEKISDLVHLLYEQFVTTREVEPEKLARALRLVA
jgi:transcriptional regulator with XRE-family HTH domain